MYVLYSSLWWIPIFWGLRGKQKNRVRFFTLARWKSFSWSVLQLSDSFSTATYHIRKYVRSVVLRKGGVRKEASFNVLQWCFFSHTWPQTVLKWIQKLTVLRKFVPGYTSYSYLLHLLCRFKILYTLIKVTPPPLAMNAYAVYILDL